MGSNKAVYLEKNNSMCKSSEDDPELVFVVRFKEPVSIKSIFIESSEALQPREINVFINRENMSYDIVNE